MMRFSLLTSLLLASQSVVQAESPQDLGITEDVLVADDGCHADAEDEDALNALQLRIQKTAVADEDAVAEASASDQELDSADADAAQEEELDEESQELDEEAQELDEEAQGLVFVEDGDLGSSRRRPASSQNMCCKCNDGTHSWSQSGSCSHCSSSGIFEKLKPPAECQEGSGFFIGSHRCAKICKSQLAGAAASSRRRAKPSGKVNPQAASVSGTANPHSPQCNKTETGGSCRLMSCSTSRGPTNCVKHKCVCKDGYCATGKKGKCEPSCKTETSGTCKLMGCSTSRGPTECKKHKCVCKAGYCANSKGTCERR